MSIYTEALDDNLAIGDTSVVGAGVSLLDSLSGSDNFLTRLSFTEVESAALSDTPAYGYAAGANGIESAIVSDILQFASTYHLSLSERAIVSSAINSGSVVPLLDNVSITDALNSVIRVTMREAVAISDAVLSQNTYRLLVGDVLVGDDALLAYNSVVLTESSVLSDALSKQYTGAVDFDDMAYVQDYLAESMRFYSLISEASTLDDDLAPQMIFNPVLDDYLWSNEYLSPDNNVSTWVLNTRTNALTEYTNWNFNSFASVGRKYIAANAQGLYELDGERDVTTNINACVSGGLVQFNGVKFAGFKGIYIGVRGQGEYFLKLVAGDARVYVYQFTSNPALMTSKVIVGKGLRSRYFQWSLVSTGPDFDLDNVEFVPMVSDRRV